MEDPVVEVELGGKQQKTKGRRPVVAQSTHLYGAVFILALVSFVMSLTAFSVILTRLGHSPATAAAPTLIPFELVPVLPVQFLAAAQAIDIRLTDNSDEQNESHILYNTIHRIHALSDTKALIFPEPGVDIVIGIDYGQVSYHNEGRMTVDITGVGGGLVLVGAVISDAQLREWTNHQAGITMEHEQPRRKLSTLSGAYEQLNVCHCATGSAGSGIKYSSDLGRCVSCYGNSPCDGANIDLEVYEQPPHFFLEDPNATQVP